ncbi:MAG: response regulator transcription factor [Deltaproteobacteria bacterium]|nr:response regulator transcription factor [Deltaproteobacteria bacterium]
MVGSGEHSHLKTLIVEDNETFRRSLKERLQVIFPSMPIEEATDGSEALRKVERFHPKLILIDLQLPGENGLKVTARIKAKHPDVSIIIVTGHDLEEYRTAALQHGALDLFTKDSINYEKLETVVRSIKSAE